MVRNTAHRSGRQGKNQTQECLRGLASFSCFMTYLTNVQIQTTHPLVTVFHRLAFNFQPVVLPTAALNIENKQWFWLEWNVMAIFHTGITLGSCFHFIFCLLNLAGKPILVTYMTQFNFFSLETIWKDINLQWALGFIWQSHTANVHKWKEMIIFVCFQRHLGNTCHLFKNNCRVTSLSINTHTDV